MKELIVFYSDLRYGKREVLLNLVSKQTKVPVEKVKETIHLLQPVGIIDVDTIINGIWPKK